MEDKPDAIKWKDDEKTKVENYPDLKRKFNEYKKLGRIEFVTFHQSYSYEEFVEGIKPYIPVWGEECGDLKYVGKDGIFKKICNRAKENPNKKFVLIIDEINRGNISKIFGELITLIEPDKRSGEDNQNQMTVTLPYSQKDFDVPNNLYIIGTMNTSDRSIASIDIALRRRFKFVEMMPNYEVVEDLKCKKVLENLNKRISILLDRDHQIGHSYFIGENASNDLKNIFFDSIIPLLNEYFYGDWDKLQAILGKAEDEKADGKIPSFITKINKPDFANNYNDCENEYFDFAKPSEIDFENALINSGLQGAEN